MPKIPNRVLLVAASLLAIGTGVTLSLPVGRLVDPTAAATRSLTELLAARSPGARATGAVATKPPLVKATHQRAKSAGLVQAADPDEAGPVLALITDAPPALSVEGIAGIGGEGALPIDARGVVPSYLPAPGFSGGGGGGGVVPPPVPGAVPEPATWLTMLVGFGALGIGLRRDGNARRAIAAEVNGARG